MNVERAEDVLMHKRLLQLAHDPDNRPAIEVKLVQVRCPQPVYNLAFEISRMISCSPLFSPLIVLMFVVWRSPHLLFGVSTCIWLPFFLFYSYILFDW